MEIDYIAFGKNIRKYRKMAGLTQKQLSEIVDCTDRHIGQIETAKNIPSLAMTVAIANGLNVGLDQLVHSDLKNQTNSFIQELTSLTEGFAEKNKTMSIDLIKALVAVLKDYEIK